MRSILALAVLLFISACDQSVFPIALPPPLHVVTLPSGKQIKAFEPGVGKTGGDTPIYMFKYLTSLPISLPATPAERAAITADIDEVWQVVRPDAEKSGAKLADVTAQTSLGTSVPSGGVIVTTAHGFGFQFKRDAAGTWSKVPPGVNPLARN